MEMASVHVDREICFGFGRCVDAHPEVFELREGQSVVKGNGVVEAHIAASAAWACPVQAIEVEPV